MKRLLISLLTFLGALSTTKCAISFNLTAYDDCGAMMNSRLNNLDAVGTIPLTGLDNPDNSIGYSIGFIRTPPSLPTQVHIDFTVLLLGGIDDMEQTMSATAKLHMQWKDSRLAATDVYCYNMSASYVVNPTRNLPWYPQWVVENGRGEMVLLSDSWEYSPVQVQDDGTVDWYMSFQFVVDCFLEVKYFPFDVQECAVMLASPQYDSRILEYAVSSRGLAMDSEDSKLAPLWKIIGVKHGPYSSKYPSISFQVLLARRATFFVAALIIPTAALNAMTLSLFITSANQEEKTSSGIACVAAYFFIEILFFSLSPMSSHSTPVLSIFFTFHSYFALFVCCIIARLVAYAEYVQEQQSIDIMLKNGIPVSNTKRTADDGVRRFISPEKYNDIGLVSYLIITLLSYVFVFAYMPIMSKSIRSDLLLNSYTEPTVA